jgi:hypothetical protein
MANAWSKLAIQGVSRKKQGGVWHTMALPFKFKSTLSKKKNFGNSNISPSKNIIYKKIL